MRVEHPHADVEGIIVVENAHRDARRMVMGREGLKVAGDPLAVARFRQHYRCNGWVVTAIRWIVEAYCFFGAVGALPAIAGVASFEGCER